MTISPNTEWFPVAKTYIEQKFDEDWEPILRQIAPQTHSSLADRSLGLPKGAVTLISTFKLDNVTIAITYRHLTAQGLTIGDRQHNPTFMLIDGRRCYPEPSKPSQ